jgi:2-amino-4-hydroxy-6-hydroxymethyldihydropteridine pyrophosphokinase
MNKKETAFIGLGSNLGDARCHVEEAFDEIAQIEDTELIARSSLYRTAPYGVTRRQPPYINAVAQVTTTLSAEKLFAAMKCIERKHRRARPYRFAPRSLDLDLLLYGQHISHSRYLTLPHPRLHERAFALIPLLELAPGTYIPGKGMAFMALRCSGIRFQMTGISQHFIARSANSDH